MKISLLIGFWVGIISLVGAGWLLPVFPSYAAVSCSMGSSPNINFGTVNGFSSGATGNGTVTFSCSNTDKANAYVTFCLNIGDGTGGLNGTNRVMNSGTNSMDFQLYQDAASTQIFGSLLSGINPSPRQINFELINRTGVYNGSQTVYGVLPGGQIGIVSGTYTSSFNGTDAMVSGTYNESSTAYPPNCGTSSAGNFPFTVTATVTKSCTISASDLNFGTPTTLLSTSTDVSTSLTAKCTAGLPYQIGLDNGQNAVAGARVMVSGTDQVNYDLYTDAGRTNRWGNTLNVDTLSVTGTGADQVSTVYGRVPAQTTPPPGVYTDTVTVSVYY